jgi:hypothetical protein
LRAQRGNLTLIRANHIIPLRRTSRKGTRAHQGTSAGPSLFDIIHKSNQPLTESDARALFCPLLKSKTTMIEDAGIAHLSHGSVLQLNAWL